ncbi:MerR family transcriptional regulator [Aeromicrobium sp. A1-2]|uniref:MerR family transcriptional regulator n=1 Tax=Aeromicrobium sp. A1-2 TaxID=2107713 RepID=UPI0013C320EB|nr:MerR family transcriptional regulator [Aeromicrobium sp. A1-2]
MTERVQGEQQATEGLRMREVSDRLGIPAPTLRSWERRYGLPTTVRSVGGHRRYTEDALNELRLMRDEIARGKGAANAARSVGLMLDLNNPAGWRVDALLDAFRSRDVGAVAAALELSRVGLGLDLAVDHVLMPAMRQVGTWWETGKCDIVQEQFATSSSRAWLARLMTLDAVTSDEPPVLLACGPRDLHTVGLEAMAALLVARGRECRVLGTPTLEPQLVAHVRESEAAAVVIVSHLPSQRREAVSAIRAVADTGCPTFYAGNAFAYRSGREGVPGTYLGESLALAAALIMEELDAERS